MTPRTVLACRGIDPSWAELHRDRARQALSESDRYSFKAEMALEYALHYCRDFDLVNFEYELNWAFEYLSVARRLRASAKRHALMAVRGADLERWPDVRAELSAQRRWRANVFVCAPPHA